MSLSEVMAAPGLLENASLDDKKKIQLEIIQEIFAKSSDAQLSSRAIKQKAQENYPDLWENLKRYWNGNTSSLAAEENAPFYRIPGSYDYASGPRPVVEILGDEAEKPASEEIFGVSNDAGGEATYQSARQERQEKQERQERQEREKNLYPCLVEWLKLKTNGYLAKNTSSARGGSKWGNPDIVGLKIIQNILGNEVLEICSVEAKPSLAGWRQFIFEAISHKRFANRTYFAFAIGSNTPNENLIPDLQELRRYAEKYKIGVLAIFLVEDVYKELHKCTDLSLSDVVIREIWPAHYDVTDPADAYAFCRNQLEIFERANIYTFGKED